MIDLKCKRTCCKHNDNCNCNAKNINISEKTDCQTYCECGKPQEKEDEIPMPLVRKNVDVKCKADCVFNKCFCCTANGITVCTEHDYPQCSTFMPE